MKDIASIILAAGRGTRMKSELQKVLHEVHSRPILQFVLEAAKGAGVEKTVVVVGYKDKEVKKSFKGLDTIAQEKLLGSGDAVKSAQNFFSKFKGDILVLCGDAPLIRKETIKSLIKKHKKEKNACTLLTANADDPSGYGRILRSDTDSIIRIIEDPDASIYEKVINEINVGCYCFDKEDLFTFLEKLKINSKKGEYYLTDIVEMLVKSGKRVSSSLCEDSYEATGINTRVDLAEANNVIRKRVLETLMLGGVTIVDPESTFVDMDAKIDKDTIIHPNTVIEKEVKIGKNCSIGPFARIREKTSVGDNVEIGNFVELVRTKVASGTKIKHLTYLGDADVGRNVNIGAGTITANYDGKKKNKTVIENGAFIGVGSILIAPVKVGSGAVVGAGSVVTKNKNVPANKTVVGVPARILKKEKKR